MNKWTLYRLLRKNDELKMRRHPMFEKNRFMKFFAWATIIYYAAILILMGVTMPMGMSGMYNGVSAFHVLDGFVVVLLIIDFWMRFIMQEIPAQTIKPYRLLPISRKFLTRMYLTQYGFSLGNLFWWFFLVPFGLMSVMPLLGWWSFVSWLVGWWLLCIVNGFLYFFVRGLCYRHLAWCLVPIAIHVGLILLMVLPETNLLDAPFTALMYQFALCNPLPYLGIGAVVAFTFWLCYKQQSSMGYNEVAKKEEIKHASKMAFFDRYGAIGEYMKLEMKLHLRNRICRVQFFTLLSLMVVFTVLLYFTHVYDSGFMLSFILLYIYIGLGAMSLATIMSYEGNYIDGLMSRRESIFALLCAKFYFNVAQMIIPFILTIPLMLIGKVSFMMNLGYLCMTIGMVYPGMFQLAVYNGNTIPLDQKVMGKKGNMMQQMASLIVLFLPIGVEKLCVLALGPVWGYIPIIALGIAGVATHKWWLHNIYTRFMARRHKNMESFRASRGGE